MINVGIGEYAISNDVTSSLITHALGSCVGVIMYCPLNHYAAMAHIVLPSGDSTRLEERHAAYFADDFLPRMLTGFSSMSHCSWKYTKVTLVGGADSGAINDFFLVGQRNLKVIRDILDARNIAYNDEETGGRYSRTVRIHIKDGEIKINKNKMIL